MKRILITGGASGLGLALTKAYAARGDQVLVGDLAPQRPDHLPEAARYLRLDVRVQQDWDLALALAGESMGGVDILVNNAGVATGGRIDVESMGDWERVVEVNLLGVARGCHSVVPLFKAQGGGQIVNIASLAGYAHAPGMSSYAAAKAGVVALSESLYYELAPFGIPVTIVAPAFFRTGLDGSLQGKDTVMERQAVHLIADAARGADEIADKVIAGVDAKKRVIRPDRDAQIAVLAKTYARPLYDVMLRRAGRRIAKLEHS